MPFTGTYTAIVTPFKNGKIDEPALERLIKMQIRAGVDGIVPVGTTGESATLDYEEHIHVIEFSVKCAGKKIKVIAGRIDGTVGPVRDLSISIEYFDVELAPGKAFLCQARSGH